MRIALVHDWLTGMRGGEKVLAELVALFPSADVFTLVWKRGSVLPEIEARVRRASFLDRLPGATTAYRYYLPLFPAAIRSLGIKGYDLILSSSHAVAKGVRVPPGAVHASYIHTPMRYLWDTGADYFTFGHGHWWKRAALGVVAPWLRRFDRATTAGVDHFIANSETVRERIRRLYGAEARVIYPPVDTDFFTPGPAPPEEYYLVVSPLEPYKRIDLAVQAFNHLNLPLRIVGVGPEDAKLRKIAGGNVDFLGEQSDEAIAALYADCRALIFPGEEDFGIVPLEAQASGKPVIAYGAGGVLETVIPLNGDSSEAPTGVFFKEQTVAALIEAVRLFEREGGCFDAHQLRSHAAKFSRPKFKAAVRAFVDEKWLEHQSSRGQAKPAHVKAP